MEIKLRILRDTYIRGSAVAKGAELDVDLVDAVTLLQVSQGELIGNVDALRSELEGILKRKGSNLQQDARVVLRYLEKLQDVKIEGG